MFGSLTSFLGPIILILVALLFGGGFGFDLGSLLPTAA